MIVASVTGVADYIAALRSIVPKLRRGALLNALRVGARVVQAAARARTPVLAVPTATRKSGTVKRAISVRVSKIATRAGDVGVFVNVRPAAGAKYKTVKTFWTGSRKRVLKTASKRGALSPDDPYYWRFINFTTRFRQGTGFLEAGAAQLPEALKAFENDLGPRLQKLDTDPKAEL